VLKLKFLGASGFVTGSCFLLETNDTKFLVDCGMFQGPKSIKELNYGDFPFNPSEIDFLLLTHAHIDHSGLIPKLYKKGFSGSTYCTAATHQLASIMLPDSGYIQEMEVERKNRKAIRAGKPLLEPIYTAADALNCIKYFQNIEYNQEVNITPKIRIRFQDAGHILGSSTIEIWIQEGMKNLKIVFSGDIGNLDQPIINDPTYIADADYVVMESTYGDRLHAKTTTNKLEQLSTIINDSLSRGGNLIIPAFAIERTQDLLYNLNKLIQSKEISPEHIFIDSPLAIQATEIFCQNPSYYDEEAKELAKNQSCPLIMPGLNFARTAEESMEINKIKSGAIIISASGMCDAGRIKHHLKHNLWRHESTILFTGYQAMGTLGRRILDGEKKVRIHGEEIAVNAQIKKLEGYSAHADQAGLLKWISSLNKPPKKIFITHGEGDSPKELANLLRDKYPQTDVYIPELYQEFVLDLPAKIEADLSRYNFIHKKLDEFIARQIEKGNVNYLNQVLAKIEHLI